ncbi:MAG: phosphopantothenoylcysteine decarboxylase [Oceanicaulis sp.]
MRAIVTAGPTLEALDPVRFLSNRSSGKQGYAVAAALRDEGFDVTLVAGPTALDDPAGLTTVHVESARDMLAAVEGALPADVFVAVAAVADWRPAETHPRKLKLDKAGLTTLALVENPDILKTLAGHEPPRRPRLVVGFAAETHDVPRLAREKRRRKGCDWIVANDVSGDAMGGEENAALIIREAGEQVIERAAKAEVARRLAAEIRAALGG